MSYDRAETGQRAASESAYEWNGQRAVEAELDEIFGESGRQVLLIEFSKRYGVSSADAVERPSAFRAALFYMLGERGSDFVMERVNARTGQRPR